MNNDLPRTLLLTWWAPDAHYKILWRIAGRFPEDRICWCSLLPCRSGRDLRFRHQSFTPGQTHWRLQGGALSYFYFNEWQSKKIAGRMAEWVRAFDPQVLWVLPELGAASTGFHLHRMLGIPLHLTVHDAHETARFIVPALYYPFYASRVDRILRHARSVDSVSEEMIAHLTRRFAQITPLSSMVFHPSVPPDIVPPDPPDSGFIPPGDVRRIGFCGSMRVSGWQWRAFLELLSRLPFHFEIVAFEYRDLFHNLRLPRNVKMSPQPFAPTEEDVIRVFRSLGVHSCHLGLYKEKDRGLFARTSLSAKLTTYAAAGIPVIVDGPEDSAAWRLVKEYGAGVLCGDDADEALQSLRTLFTDQEARGRMGEGSRRLCLEKFNLDANFSRFAALLRTTAGLERREEPTPQEVAEPSAADAMGTAGQQAPT